MRERRDVAAREQARREAEAQAAAEAEAERERIAAEEIRAAEEKVAQAPPREPGAEDPARRALRRPQGKARR